MKIDFFKLNNLGNIEIDQDFTMGSEYYQGTEVRDIKNLHVSGVVRIEVDDIVASIEVKGTFVLPCAITNEDVDYDFDTEIDEIIGSYDDLYKKNKVTLDLNEFIWSNIIAEIPMRVVKEGVKIQDINGDGWELVSGQE